MRQSRAGTVRTSASRPDFFHGFHARSRGLVARTGESAMTSSHSRTILCPGCGARVPDIEGATHPYIGASAGCWNRYGEVLAREYGEFGYPECHRLTVDTYAVQHPGRPSRKSIQSVGVHLLSLHALLEEGLGAAAATARLRQALRSAHPFTWLAPPPFAGTMTVLDVARASSLDEHQRLVRQWAESVWIAWSIHHATVRAWAASAPR